MSHSGNVADVVQRQRGGSATRSHAATQHLDVVRFCARSSPLTPNASERAGGREREEEEEEGALIAQTGDSGKHILKD